LFRCHPCASTRGGQRRLDAESETLIPTIGGGFDVAHSLRGEGFDAGEDGTGRGTPLVPVVMKPVAFQEIADCLTSAYGTKWNGNASATNGSLFAFHPTQDPISSSDGSTHAMGCGSKGGAATVAVAMVNMQGSKGNAVAQPVAMRESGQGYWMEDSIAGTLRAEGEDRPSRPSHVIGIPPTVAVAVDTYNHTITGDYAGSLTTTGGPPLSGPGVLQAMQVRRLTPTECERLQGFPDDYTLIPVTKRQPITGQPAVVKWAADGPRYKALGNSWAVPVVRWIGRRINEWIGDA